MERAGFTPGGLEVTASLWRVVELTNAFSSRKARRISRDTANVLVEGHLVDPRFSEADAEVIVETWPMPMWGLDLGRDAVDLEELRRSRKGSSLKTTHDAAAADLGAPSGRTPLSESSLYRYSRC